MGRVKRRRTRRSEDLDKFTNQSQPEFDVSADLEIDDSNIEQDWIELPGLLYKYGQALAKAEQEVNDCEEKIKTSRSQLILEISDKPKAFGLEKTTAQSIEACYRIQPEYTNLKKKLNKLTHEVSSIRNVVYSLNAKRTALESLTKLLLQEYYNSHSGINEDEGDTRKRIGKSLKRNK